MKTQQDGGEPLEVTIAYLLRELYGYFNDCGVCDVYTQKTRSRFVQANIMKEL